VGGERSRPHDAGIVVVLLDGRSHRPGDADAVASHLDRTLLPIGPEERGAHRARVLGAEVEHLADLDPAMHGELAAVAPRTAVAGPRLAQTGEGDVRKVARLVHAHQVLVAAV